MNGERSRNKRALGRAESLNHRERFVGMRHLRRLVVRRLSGSDDGKGAAAWQGGGAAWILRVVPLLAGVWVTSIFAAFLGASGVGCSHPGITPVACGDFEATGGGAQNTVTKCQECVQPFDAVACLSLAICPTMDLGDGTEQRFIDGPCPRAGAAGGCRIDAESGYFYTTWFYVNSGATVSDASKMCADSGGTFVSP